MTREAYVPTEYRIVNYLKDGVVIECIEVATHRDDVTQEKMVTISYGPGEVAVEWQVPLKSVTDTGKRVSY